MMRSLLMLLLLAAAASAGQGSSKPPPTRPSPPKQQPSPPSTALPVNTEAPAKTGRILFYMPLTSRSMKITFLPLAEALAERGHEVVVLMPHPSKERANLKVITVDSPFEALTESMSKDLLKEGSSKNAVSVIFELVHGALETNDNALGSPELRRELEKSFDVVLVSPFIASEAGYHLAYRSGASLVSYFTGQVSISFLDWSLGQPHNPAYLPFALTDWQPPLSFPKRVANTIGTLALEVVRDFYFIRKGEELLDKHFPGEPRVPLMELERNTSLALHYGHPMIMDGMRPLAPNFQYIGMMNCRVPQPLPADLAAFMESPAAAEHGVVYVSFGSVLQAKEMSEYNRKMLVRVFGGLKQRVIWKWETEDMADKPDNLKLSKWLPQQDILGHPNTRLFITHAGQSSTQETLCHQTPIVAIPVTGDQPANANEAERVGFGKAIKFQELTEDKLSAAIREVLEDPEYTRVAREHGSIVNDQITRPLDRAVWWLEFLIRHPGKNHMRSPVHDLAWYQYFLMDVLLFLGGVVSLFAFLVCKLCAGLCRRRATAATPPRTDAKKKRN